MKLKKCLLTFLIGFSLLFSSVLTSCGDTPKSNENEVEQPDSEDKESEKDKESEEENDSEEAAKEKEYTVTFNVDGGSEVKSQIVKEGAKATKPASNPTKTGYDFEGWFSDSSRITAFNFDTAINADTTIYAKWKTAAGYFEVTFNTNGGSAIEKVSVKEGQKVTKPADPTKNYYKFVGWYSDKELKNSFDFNTVIKAATTLYAKWELQGKVDFTLTQEPTEGITKSATGYTFTAPAGYADYEWTIKGSAIGEGFLAPDNDAKTVCTLSSSFWGSKLAIGAEYIIEVKAYNASGELQKIYKYLLVLEEDM